MRDNLHSSLQSLQRTVNACNLSFAVLLIACAALGDRYGRRRMLAAGLVLFGLASAACALAPNVGTLIAARAFHGAGATIIVPLFLTVVTVAFPPERLRAALGGILALGGLAVGAGPLIGGALTENRLVELNNPLGSYT